MRKRRTSLTAVEEEDVADAADIEALVFKSKWADVSGGGWAYQRSRRHPRKPSTRLEYKGI